MIKTPIVHRVALSVNESASLLPSLEHGSIGRPRNADTATDRALEKSEPFESFVARLAQAESALWEKSLEGDQPDMMLPPMLLQATMRAARADMERSPRSIPLRPSGPKSARLQQASLQPRPPTSARRRDGKSDARSDVQRIVSALDARVRAEGESALAFDMAFEAAIAQVREHCVERGELLSRVREWLLRHVWWLESEVRQARHEAHRAAERADGLMEQMDRLASTIDDEHKHMAAESFKSDGGSSVNSVRNAVSSRRRTLGAEFESRPSSGARLAVDKETSPEGKRDRLDDMAVLR